MSNDSTKKTIMVALGVCLVCSILVSTAAVALKGIQKDNQNRERLKNILQAGDLLHEGGDIQQIYQKKIRPELVDLKSGLIIQENEYSESLNPETFDIKVMARDPEYGRSIPAKLDLPKIRRMPKIMVIYKVIEEEEVYKYILPIYGNGLWSTMYGFIALSKDLKTVQGFTFYEHGETPGLGGEVDNPLWKKLWVGKQVFDLEGNIRIEVIKGKVDPSRNNAKYQIDGLSGSTLTTRGVDQTVRFWLGENGYGPFFQKIREEG